MWLNQTPSINFQHEDPRFETFASNATRAFAIFWVRRKWRLQPSTGTSFWEAWRGLKDWIWVKLDGHVPEMLEAASTYCLYLEFLILPQPSEVDEWPSMEDVVAPVVLGLERWHSKGNCDGLKQLIVPMYPGQNLHRQETELLEGITEYCPRIEFLDSCDDIDREVEARRVWSVSSETWEKFNASCTALKQFSFALVPFADPFFRVFGEYVKPHLKVLNLSANSTCDFEQYFRDVDGLSDQNSLRPGYGVLASSPSSALKGCPALTTLLIQIDYYVNEDPELEGRYVNADVYGDIFWEAVAEYCPLLESIEMIGSSFRRTYNVWPIHTLTGRTLLVLAGLKRLSALELAPARLTGKDIFEYIRCLSKVEDTMGTQQDIHLEIGGHERATFSLPSFYLESLTLLVLLSQESEESLGASTCRQKPVVHVWNPYRSRVSPPWSYGYLTKDLRTALEAVKEAHPSLGVAVHIQGRDEGKFSRIERITLDWSHPHNQDVFFDMADDEDATYLEASVFEVNSGLESDESDDGEDFAYG
ncbi:hypothetical protein PF010_g20634 [Phytophthora fragariae]|nr:hypothetical protein PF009_g22204 [Phytophthora fragariae]KAE9084959.1 hypothetical protein PF010_g20634 [Phytophthora fragariae]